MARPKGGAPWKLFFQFGFPIHNKITMILTQLPSFALGIAIRKSSSFFFYAI